MSTTKEDDKCKEGEVPEVLWPLLDLIAKGMVKRDLRERQLQKSAQEGAALGQSTMTKRASTTKRLSTKRSSG